LKIENLEFENAPPWHTTITQVYAGMTKLWSAVTRHRFDSLAGLPARQSRVQRLGSTPHAREFNGDKSPAESGENSPHSKSLWRYRKPHKF
jgi:hypothetical protein